MTLSDVDTLCCDTAQIRAWQHDGAYDYQRELMDWQPNLWEWLMMQVRDFLASLLGSETASTVSSRGVYTTIRQAIAIGDYRQAVRYVYLQTLRHLSDHSLIDWMPQKTPNQYTVEYNKEDFRRLTTLFLRVRYGNFEATPSMYDSVVLLQSSIIQKEERP